MLRTLLAFLMLLAAPGVTRADDEGESVPPAAWIVASEADGVATLEVHADFPRAGGGRYSLSIEKRGPNGQSSTVQTGTLPNREAGVARVAQHTHSLAASERLVAILTVTAPDGTERREEVTLGGVEE